MLSGSISAGFATPRSRRAKAAARHELARRKARISVLPAALDTNPGWDIMLELYDAGELMHDELVKALSLPHPVIARWLRVLAAEELVITDQEMATLSSRTREAFEDYYAPVDQPPQRPLSQLFGGASKAVGTALSAAYMLSLMVWPLVRI